MRTYVCVRRRAGQRDGAPFTVLVTVSTPRYVKRGHSFVTVFREDEQGRKTCLFPAQEVPGAGDHAARAFLASLGWMVCDATVTPKPRCPRAFRASRAPHHPHKPLSVENTPSVDEVFQRAAHTDDLSW